MNKSDCSDAVIRVVQKEVMAARLAKSLPTKKEVLTLYRQILRTGNNAKKVEIIRGR
jgi:hypothetical protein